MKKIYLSLVAVAVAVMSYGQYDLEVILDNPESGSIQDPSANQEVSFTIVNNGPDATKAGDTLWIAGMWLEGQTDGGYFALDDGTPNGVNGLIIPEAIEAGQGVSSNMIEPAIGGPVVFNTTSYAEGTMVGVVVIGIAEDPNNIPQGDPNDANIENNADFFIIGENDNVSVDNEVLGTVSVYPNPAVNQINVDLEGLNEANVVITSVTGQVVVNTTINGSNTIDVSSLNNGLYIYTVRNKNNEIVKTNKLVIRK